MNVLDVEVVDMVVYDFPIPVDRAALDIFVDKANTVKHQVVQVEEVPPAVLDTVRYCWLEDKEIDLATSLSVGKMKRL